MSAKKWTKEACYEVALSCKTQAELRKKAKGAYMAAYRNEWLKDYTWFVLVQKPKGYWNKKRCEEEARKYKTKNDFQKINGSAYMAALKNNWLDEYEWFENGYELAGKNNTVWTFEKCKEVALKYDNLTDFYEKSSNVYNITRKRGWLSNFDWLVRKENIHIGHRDNVYAYVFSEYNSIYIGRTVNISVRDNRHHTDERSTVNRFAKQNNTSVPKMTILESGLTLEDGLEKEDYYVNKYRSEGWNVLNKAKTGKRSGAIGCLNSHKWNRKTCYEEAKKYNSRTQFCRENGSAYHVARKNGWLDDYTWMKTKNRKAYKPYGSMLNKEKCVAY